MGLAAGKLNRRITIRRPVLSSDGHGGQQQTWGLVATVWAEAVSQNGREAVIAGALQGVSAMRFSIRHRRDVDSGCQIEYDGKTFNVRTAEDPDGRRIETRIFADTESVQS